MKLRLKVLKDGKRSYWLDIYHKGFRKTELLEIVTSGGKIAFYKKLLLTGFKYTDHLFPQIY